MKPGRRSPASPPGGMLGLLLGHPASLAPSQPALGPSLQLPPEQPGSPTALPGRAGGGHGVMVPCPPGEGQVGDGPSLPSVRSHPRLLSSAGGGGRGGSCSAPPAASSRQVGGAPFHHSPSALPLPPPATAPLLPPQAGLSAESPLRVYVGTHMSVVPEKLRARGRASSRSDRRLSCSGRRRGSVPRRAYSDAALRLDRLVQKCRCLCYRSVQGSHWTLADAESC